MFNEVQLIGKRGAMMSHLTRELEENGIALLPDLLTQDQLRGMQRAFEVRLRRVRWNDFDGYEKTEPYRHMVQDVLTLDQSFVDTALHPMVKQALREYLGDRFQLVEAKGWKSLPVKRDFHGWHGDGWYDQAVVRHIPREVKLGIYVTDVKSGAFNYIKGTHRKQAPRPVRHDELKDVPRSTFVEVTGPAGLAFLFDTSGIHRQGVPILEERQAVFFNYHDPDVPIQREDLDYYRYHPLLLNAAFLGNLSQEDQRILGFGNKTSYIHAFERRPKHSTLQTAFRVIFDAKLRTSSLERRVLARLRRTSNSGVR
ncbi:MAG: phytanoyl-CoA dioxygenase family protein [Candidatus Binatia bacterium]